MQRLPLTFATATRCLGGTSRRLCTSEPAALGSGSPAVGDGAGSASHPILELCIEVTGHTSASLEPRALALAPRDAAVLEQWSLAIEEASQLVPERQ
jgi:hypothetical protein